MFIDNANIFHGQLAAGWRIDFRRLHTLLAGDGEIWQGFLFASVSDPPRYRQTMFYRFMKREMRYEVTVFQLGSKTIRCRECRHTARVPVEKGVDVALATKMLTLANNRAFDTAILAGADKDYLETVRAVKANGLRVEIAAWRGTISSEMEEESSTPVLYFDDLRDQIELTRAPDLEAEKLAAGGDDAEEAAPAAVTAEPAATRLSQVSFLPGSTARPDASGRGTDRGGQRAALLSRPRPA